MKLEQTSVVIRPRSHWEAIDLGFMMARAWWRPLFTTWFIVTLPSFLLLQLLFKGSLWIAPLFMWWLKPFWERIPLHILSRAFFGDVLTPKETIKAMPTFAFKQSLSWLTFRRLSPTRAFDLPSTQLEGLSGEARRQRLKVLHRTGSHAAFWLFAICAHVEGFLYLAFISLSYLFVPSHMGVQWLELLTGERLGILLANNFISYFSMSLVAPFYVAGGFSLYLNRRIELEAWDIELVFRRLEASWTLGKIGRKHSN